MNTSHELNAPNITDTATVLELEGLTVLRHDSGPDEPGVRLYLVEGLCDRVEVRPVVDGLEKCPMGGGDFNERRSQWVQIMATVRNVLVAYGWERHGETLLGGQFLTHTPVVREARVALANAEIALLPTGALDGRGALVHPVDGDPGSVRVVVHAGGFRYKPGPWTMEWESAGAREWRALMHECLDVMDAAGWTLAHTTIYDDAQFRLPHDADTAVRDAPVLGCDPEADDFVQSVARVLRAAGHVPMAAARRDPESLAWGFTVIAPDTATDHVAVSYDSTRMRSFSSRPYEPAERAGFFAVLAGMREELTRNGLTVVEAENAEMVWVRRPPASTRARIVLADESGFAWLPEVADEYQQETRWSLAEPWAPQLRYDRDHVLCTVESMLRKGVVTAEAEGQTIYLSATVASDFAPYSRYVPAAGGINEALATTLFPTPSDGRTPTELKPKRKSTGV
uniref:hypothetical protein n=1 Tax=Streptomyces sp. CA-136453 TaxID=3240050 RepID=UPI003F499962